MTLYTDPRTWSDEELVTAALLNTHLRDNMKALKDPPTDLYDVDEGSNYSTSSTSFVDVDATDLALSITLQVEADVLITFQGNIYCATADYVYLDVHESVGAARLAGDDGIVSQYSNNLIRPISFAFWVLDLAAGAHTFKLQWKTASGNTAVMYAGAGTGGGDLHPQLVVREVS